MSPTVVPFDGGAERLERWERFPARGLPPRTVDVWRSGDDPDRLAPTLLCHDGQNLFEPGAAIGGVAWEIHRALRGLGAPAMVVGVWNTPDRMREYLPYDTAAAAYAAFLADELLPWLARRYPVDPTRTFLLGSSMGGLVSLYALTERPDAFAGAACLSTHWPIGGEALVDRLADALPEPGRHRLYFDYGTAGLDALYEPLQRRMDSRLAAAGYISERDRMTRRFDGADHNEAAWRDRVSLPLEFLLRGG